MVQNRLGTTALEETGSPNPKQETNDKRLLRFKRPGWSDLLSLV